MLTLSLLSLLFVSPARAEPLRTCTTNFKFVRCGTLPGRPEGSRHEQAWKGRYEPSEQIVLPRWPDLSSRR